MTSLTGRLRSLPGGRAWLYILGAVALVAVGYLFLRPASAGADTYITAAVERGRIRTSISATGTLQAVLTVQVGSQVTGRIQSLHADFNSLVRSGQVIARIDPATFEAALIRARADREDAYAGIATARAGLINQQASLEASVVSREDAARLHRRSQELAKEGIASQRDLEASEVALHEAEARHKQAVAQVESATAGIEQARARVKQAEAQVKLAEVNLNYTVIASPVDGVVVSRNVDVGQTVAASLQAPTLFVIANDLTRMQVVANVDEADIGHVGPQAEVSFTVDSFPGEQFTGTIDQIRLNPTVTQNVVTYSVIVAVANPDLKLRPGMTANTTFTIAEVEDALRLPNAALRFWPEEVPRDSERDLIASAFKGAENVPADGVPDQAAGSPVGEARRSSLPAGRQDAAPPVAGAAETLRFPQLKKVRYRPRVIWVKADGGAQPRVIHVGITDGSASEVRPGDLNDGDLVIIGTSQMASSEPRPNNPFGSPLSGRPSMKGSGGRRN